ncbi:hypothetical protein HanHA300_Chr09g0321881 [Helianthus annuus]|nr:hypothetical protein HanHA300_Chr09g0321881 [Helianthus annuus]KAJ0534737.1 hypothetical protein HanIR_Chr09g0423021 [Helianthus annuus]KAJ0542718.1 hypothetical protein HanHA89_Chr09g0342831 [Helianthus annuus]KAJ0707778.1 hypothetical protein HanLR1_Chr09g0322161 [Helianthus annuus]KAJ0711755.1 hypothetical protein HanOQP8_Chr09g0327291 [Helianthus annuus]
MKLIGSCFLSTFDTDDHIFDDERQHVEENRLFTSINNLPTVYEAVKEWLVVQDKSSEASGSRYRIPQVASTSSTHPPTRVEGTTAVIWMATAIAASKVRKRQLVSRSSCLVIFSFGVSV